jgi:hypothetical protein
MLSKLLCIQKTSINRKVDVPTDPLPSQSNNSTSSYHHTHSQKLGAEVFVELAAAKIRKKAARNPLEEDSTIGNDDTGVEKPVLPPTLGFSYGHWV